MTTYADTVLGMIVSVDNMSSNDERGVIVICLPHDVEVLI